MKFRKTIIAVATTAALAVVPATVAFAGGSRDSDCKDGSHWKDYKYSAQCECNDDHDKDHRDKTYDHPKERQTSYAGRVLKTN